MLIKPVKTVVFQHEAPNSLRPFCAWEDGSPGEPIEFATVRLLGTAVGTNTDTKGQYEMTVPKADTVMVEFSCLGYSTVTRQLIKPEGTVTINPKLYEKTLELGEVEITEYKKQTTGMQGIDVDMLRRTPDASGGSVEAVLTTMAGVSSKNELSSQYMVRGGSYDPLGLRSP